MASEKKRVVKAEPVRRKDVRKDEIIRLRVTEDQKNALTGAAEAAGASLSTWLLMVGLREARKGGA